VPSLRDKAGKRLLNQDPTNDDKIFILKHRQY